MAQPLPPITITFGGGINSTRRAADIEPEECVKGQNFDLDPRSSVLRRRKPFDLVATATNGESIRGYAQLVKRDDTISTLIQAGGTVYSWDGATSFTDVGSVPATARLRGPKAHNYPLDEIVLITDLEKLKPVMTWDGTDFAVLAHNLGGDFFAKYLRIQNERAIFANVTSTTDTPHVVVGSKVSDPTILSISDRPSSSLAVDDPFFIPVPDLRPINGLEAAFGIFAISTERGVVFKFTGSSSKDFNIVGFHEGSAVSGTEAMVNIGNDVFLGQTGRIDSLIGTDRFGDVEADDKTFPISDLVEDVVSWTFAYDRLRQKVFCFPNNQAAVYVFHKTVQQTRPKLSPWSRWATKHSIGFSPTTTFAIRDPLTGLDRVYMGDDAGGIYLIDGDSTGQDGGTDDITMDRTSAMVEIPRGQLFDAEGHLSYRKLFAATVTITLLWQGHELFDQSIVIKIPEGDVIAVYGGDHHYNDGETVYGSSFSQRLTRRNFDIAGTGHQVQARIEVEGSTDISIEEVTLNLRAAA